MPTLNLSVAAQVDSLSLSPKTATSPTLTPPEWASLVQDASSVISAALAPYLRRARRSTVSDELLVKRLELDVLRHCLTEASSSYATLKSLRMAPHTHVLTSPTSPTTYTLVSPVSPVARCPRIQPLMLPPELIAYILTLAHAQDDLYLLHLCPGGTDPPTRRFAATLQALAPLPDVRRAVLASATARAGLHAHAGLAQALADTNASEGPGASMKLCVLFGARDERRSRTDLGIRNALPLLLAHASRWRELRIEGWDRVADVAFLRTCAPALPFLRRLQFVVNGTPGDGDEEDNRLIGALFTGIGPDSDENEKMDVEGDNEKRIEMKYLEFAHISAQYLPGFIRSGALAHVRTLRVQVCARRGAAPLASCLAYLAQLRELRTLEIIEEGYGYAAAVATGMGMGFNIGAGGGGGFAATANAALGLASPILESPVEALACEDKKERLCIPSLRRIRTRGVSQSGAMALAWHLSACNGVEALEMDKTPAAPCGKANNGNCAGVGTETLLQALHVTFPRLLKLAADADLPGMLNALATPFPVAEACSEEGPKAWPLPHLRTLKLEKPVAPRAVADMLDVRCLAAGNGEVAPLVRLELCLKSTSPASMSTGFLSTQSFSSNPMAGITGGCALEGLDDELTLRELESFVPHVIHTTSSNHD